MAVCCMPKKDKFEKLSEIDFEHLNSENNLTKKILALEKMLCLTDTEINERIKIVHDITYMLRKYYPECDIIVFGSSNNGFGFTGCDLDLLFLPFPGYCNLDFKGKGKGIIPSPSQVQKGIFTLEDLYTMDEETHLKFVQRIMYSKKYYFRRILFIPAKCPILNIELVGRPIQCDFSASNRLVVNNTQLLWFYGRFDQRVRPLVMFLRFWAKSLGFITKSNLSSYAFTLMVIFYLQNIQPCVLPSVKCLTELAGYSSVIDGWETAICLDLKHSNAFNYGNTNSVDELLIGFLDFYFDFDFIKNVVSPHFGTPISVEDLKNSKDERIRDFHVTPFSIQDPFILSRNISRNTIIKTSFKLSLLIAKKLLLKKDEQFHLIFDPSYYQESISAMCSPTKMNVPTNSTFCTLQLSYELHCKLGMTTKLNPWFELVCQIVLDVLQYGLLLECEVVDKTLWNSETNPPPTKRRKINPDSPGDIMPIMLIQCTVPYPTLWNRKKIQVSEHLNDEVDQNMNDCLRKDYEISKVMSKNNFDPNPLRFICSCFQYPFAELPDVIIGISPLTDPALFSEIRDFVRGFVIKHAKKILETV